MTDKFLGLISATALVAALSASFASQALAAARQPVAGTPTARGTETRVYEVRIDNKPAGNYELKLVDTDKGVDVTSNCQVDYRVLVFHYKYRYRGHEHWQSGKLHAFDSDCVDDGKHIVISATSSGNILSVTVNGKTSALPADTLTSSYWRLPSPEGYSAKFLEVDSGRVYNAKFQYLGMEPITIGLKPEQCRHFKLSGGDQGELWYDSENRLVKEISDDDGHATTIQLKRVDHEQPDDNRVSAPM